MAEQTQSEPESLPSQPAVQVTFALEIASMQMSPAFAMSCLQLKPVSNVVSMRLAPNSEPTRELPTAFEVVNVQLTNGALGTIRLRPSASQQPVVLPSPAPVVSGLEFVARAESSPMELTPSHQEQASVRLTAQFQLSAIEFSPIFEVEAIVLKSASKDVSIKLPGLGGESRDGAAAFEIENVQLGPSNSLGLIQVAPGRRA